MGRDCLQVAEERLLREGWADSEALLALRQEVTREVEAAAATAQREPAPDPFKEDWCALSSRHLREIFEAPIPSIPA